MANTLEKQKRKGNTSEKWDKQLREAGLCSESETGGSLEKRGGLREVEVPQRREGEGPLEAGVSPERSGGSLR